MKTKLKEIKPTAQEIQDEIFRAMPADKKIKLTSQLTMLCLELNSLGNNGDHRPKKITGKNSFNI